MREKIGGSECTRGLPPLPLDSSYGTKSPYIPSFWTLLTLRLPQIQILHEPQLNGIRAVPLFLVTRATYIAMVSYDLKQLGPPRFLTTIITCLLSLIGIGSDLAFNELMSLSTSGLFSSYLVAASLLLWRRCTGGISGSKSEHTMINTAGAQLVWGPFHVPGVWGILINTFAVGFMTIAVFFSFWPPMNNVSAESMNYSVVGMGGVILLSLLYYLVRARKVYKGPVVEIQIS
ncbi:hypothetical protein BDV26DRAFT_295169 [Aspergillus bertholletiae]|uniref:Uncharacterized protein n=1 Tax=Aspergillus bertholletiae TaxID=1226010 RepID=A0A5N7AZH3_9EURO|nr:hypothetical protein BDV26DRAFT_295169 [Aspergillus bertholletiae]